MYGRNGSFWVFYVKTGEYEELEALKQNVMGHAVDAYEENELVVMIGGMVMGNTLMKVKSVRECYYFEANERKLKPFGNL